MRIENELLVDDPRFVDVTFRGTRTPDRLYPLEEPDTVVIHYDVCLTLDENTNAVMASGYDYHLAAFGEMRDGERVVEMRQYVPFNYRGAHAKGFNHRSIGIAFVNPGPLVEIPGQSGLWTVTKPQRLWTGGVVHAKQPGAGYEKWAAYDLETVDMVGHVIGMLLRLKPSLKKIVRHSDVTPGKIDPGPAFPMERLKTMAFAYRG